MAKKPAIEITKCGGVLLTKKDYKVSKWLHRIIRFLNFILPKRDENDTENLAIMNVKFKRR